MDKKTNLTGVVYADREFEPCLVVKNIVKDR
jgi:hypothetical protein